MQIYFTYIGNLSQTLVIHQIQDTRYWTKFKMSKYPTNDLNLSPLYITGQFDLIQDVLICICTLFSLGVLLILHTPKDVAEFVVVSLADVK